jgi:hypothetical protein
MLAMGDDSTLNPRALRQAFSRNRAIVTHLPYSPNPCAVLMSDARDLPLPEQSIDLVVTSPPYINVFNYHQNYRRAMELMGWDLLQVARSEIGSNRKNRANRFMTVVQFCMDIAQVLRELRRVIRPTGVAVFVIGRESRVRRIRFHNARILALLALGTSVFRLQRWQERKFTNRFGTAIYEDLLTLTPAESTMQFPEDLGRLVGVSVLTDALRRSPSEQAAEIEEAIAVAHDLRPSPLFKPPTTAFTNALPPSA